MLPALYKDIPVYNIHKKGFGYQKMIRNSIKPLVLPSDTSESSNISKSSQSSESNLNFLESPVIKPTISTNKSIVPYNYPEPDQGFHKEYRQFLQKSVAVVRRRPFDAIPSEDHLEIKLESPMINKNFSKKSGVNIATNKSKKLKIPDIPLYLYENFRFQQVCKEISARRMMDKKYRLEKLRNVKSEFKLNSKDKVEIPVWSKGIGLMSTKNFEAGADGKAKNEGKSATQNNIKFLPARKRYLKLQSETLY